MKTNLAVNFQAVTGQVIENCLLTQKEATCLPLAAPPKLQVVTCRRTPVVGCLPPHLAMVTKDRKPVQERLPNRTSSPENCPYAGSHLHRQDQFFTAAYPNGHAAVVVEGRHHFDDLKSFLSR